MSNPIRRSNPIRQGDVLVLPVEAPTGDLTPVKRQEGRLILAEGEVTGHAHAISDADTSMAMDAMEVQFLSVGEPGATLTHEEHAAHTLDPGHHAVIRQVEYSPEALRRVAD